MKLKDLEPNTLHTVQSDSLDGSHSRNQVHSSFPSIQIIDKYEAE